MDDLTSLILREDRPAMALCSVCPEPGLCCRDFTLNFGTAYEDETPEQVEARMAEWFAARPHNGPHEQFKALRFHSDVSWLDDEGRRYGFWRFMCTALTPGGRCSIYESRPLPCRTYAPGNDGMCAFHGFAGEPLSGSTLSPRKVART